LRDAVADPVSGEVVGPEAGEGNEAARERQEERPSDEQAVDERPDLPVREVQYEPPSLSRLPRPTGVSGDRFEVA
jgi:hypothetical protein